MKLTAEPSNLTVLANRPKVPTTHGSDAAAARGARRSGAPAARRRADVTSDGDQRLRQRARSPTHRAPTASPDRRRGQDPGRAARVAAGRPRSVPATPPAPLPVASDRLERRPRRQPTAQHAISADRDEARSTAAERPTASASPARTRIASSGSSVVRTAGDRGRRSSTSCHSPGPRRDAERRSRARPTRPARCAAGPASPGGARRAPVGRVRGRPDRFARDHDQARHRARRASTAISSRPSRTSNGDAPRGCSSNGPPAVAAADAARRVAAEHERPMGVVLELVLGVDPAVDPDVARAGRRRARRASATG